MENKVNNENILVIKDLVVEYHTDDADIHAVNGVDLYVKRGETLGLVGETGAGKTSIARSILRILPDPPAKIMRGEIFFNGEDILKISEKKMRAIRGNEISMIFQDPMTALNPVISVGDQISEVILQHQNCTKHEAELRMIEMLEKVGIPAERAYEYPHQFSGGMKQRIVIAIALACEPSLLIADEPTTALDVTIQAQVLEMINTLKFENKTSMLMITHDLGIVAETCDDVAIMYAGEIVEYGTLEDVFDRTGHPYTVGLFGSIPRLDLDVERLAPIPGLMPDPANLPTGCKFHPRCPRATQRCAQELPPYAEVTPGHFVRCFVDCNAKEEA